MKYKLPEGWEEVRLGEVINIKHGYGFKSNNFSDELTNRILLTPGNFKVGGGFLDTNLKYYKEDIELNEEFILSRNDIIVTMTDLSKNIDTLGYSALIPDDSCTYLHNQRIGLVVFLEGTDEILEKDYLYWVMRSYNYQRYIANTSTGTTVHHTAPKTIATYRMKLPPLPEQKAIAATLSALDDKIELNNRINENLEAQAQAIFKHWFVDFEFPDENGNPYKSAGGKMVESELGMIPEGYRVKKLKEISEKIVLGKTPKTSEKDNFGNKIPFLTIPDMHGKVYVDKTERMLSEKGKETQPSKTVPKNSICVSCIATPGLVVLTKEPTQTNQQINTIIPALEYMYVFSYMKYISKLIVQLGTGGTATNNLNKTQFSNIDILVPGQKQLENFQFITEKLFDSIKINQTQNQLLSQLRDTLLPKLMSGEIRLPPED